MALTHTIMVPTSQTVLGNCAILAIQQGGHTAILTHQKVQQSNVDGFCRLSFVWNGNVYIPVGSSNATYGWAKYNHDLGLFESVLTNTISARFIPILDRIGYFDYLRQAWGYSPENIEASVGTVPSQNCPDYAVFGQSIVICDKVWNSFRTWAYPFTTPPAGSGGTLAYTARVCELGGKIYTVTPDTGTQELRLYDVSTGVLSLVGTPTVHPLFNYHVQPYPSRQCLFKFNNKLFFMLPNSSSGYQRMRLFEINVTTGASIERTSYLPAGWQATYSGADGSCFEVRDDITPNEQVFIFWHTNTVGAWECYEFQEGAFLFVDSGTELLYRGAGGVVYDPTAKAAQIKTAGDSVPSSYVTTQIETYDKNANGLVDIDPRYRWHYTETPPYPQCTEKAGVGSEGVVNLSTKPAGITALTDLADDFDDAIIDEELWERVNLSLSSAFLRDQGHGFYNYVGSYTLAEISGALRFGRIGDMPATYLGVGVRSKWKIDGAFMLDFTLANPENLSTSGSFSANSAMIVLVRTAPNEGYGFAVWRSSILPYYRVRGLFMSKDANFVFSSDVTTVVDGDIIRIARDATNTWSVVYNPSSPTDITPVGSSYADPVEIVMGCITTSALWIFAGTPVGSEPGIKNLAVSGAGAVGRYQGGVKHTFAWDHVTDLGAGMNGAAELYVDSQRP